MYVQWTHHIEDSEDKVRFERTILNAKSVLDRQLEIIDDLKAELELNSEGVTQFEVPAWSQKQAYLLGYKAGLNKIASLINLDKQKIPTDQQETNVLTRPEQD
jgi:hypothetical protein